MVKRDFIEEVVYDTVEELKQDYLDHRKRYKEKYDVIRSPSKDGKFHVTYNYAADVGEQWLRLGPRQLPPHIEATYNLTLESKDVKAISHVMNNLEDYYPGMNLYSYGITQAKGEAATAMICLVNYEPEEEEEEETEEEDEDGDIDLL